MGTVGDRKGIGSLSARGGEKNEALLAITLPDGSVCNRMVNFFVTKRGDKRVAVRGINQLIKAGDTITISRIARREAA